MHCSTYLSLPTLESLAHSSSSASSTSSSCSLFDADPQASDSQSDSSPLEKGSRSQGSTSITPPLKFLPDHACRLMLNAKPKQKLRQRTSDLLSSNDDVGYDSDCERYASTASMNWDKLLVRRRGASHYHSMDSTSPTFQGKDPSVLGSPCVIPSISPACVLPTPDTPRTIDSALQSPKEDVGPDLGLFGEAISGEYELVSASAPPPLAYPPKPRLLPVIDAASPSPIFPLPSPILDVGTSHRLGVDMPGTSPAALAQESPPWHPSYMDVVDIPEQKTPSVRLDFQRVNPPNYEIRPADHFDLPIKIPTDDCSVNQTNSLESASHNSGVASVGLGLGISPPDPKLQTLIKDTQKTLGGAFPVITRDTGGPLSQAIAFASIPFYSAQRRRKKSAIGLGLGRPASLDHRPQMEHAPRPVFLSRLPSCVTGICSPRDNSTHASPSIAAAPPCSLIRERFVAGARRLLKAHRFPKRCLYAIPEVLSPTCFSQNGISGTRVADAAKLVFSPPSFDTSITAHLLQSGSQPKIKLWLDPPRSDSPKLPKPPFGNASRMSPILICHDVPQKLDCVKRGRSAGNGLRGLF